MKYIILFLLPFIVFTQEPKKIEIPLAKNRQIIVKFAEDVNKFDEPLLSNPETEEIYKPIFFEKSADNRTFKFLIGSKNFTSANAYVETYSQNYEIVFTRAKDDNVKTYYTIGDITTTKKSNATAQMDQLMNPNVIVTPELKIELTEIINRIYKNIKRKELELTAVEDNKSYAMNISGIYYYQDKLYFRVEMYNKGQIPFDIEGVSFKIKRETDLSQKENDERIITPLFPSINDFKATDKQKRQVKNNTPFEQIFVFSKFGLKDGEVLTVTIAENNSGRAISLPISKLALEEKTFNLTPKTPKK